MHISETVKQAFNSLLANKLRSSLTLLALVIGVFSVTVSTTAVAVLDNFFTNTMSILGSDVVTVQRTPAIQTGPREANMRNRKKITFEDAERLQELIKIGEGVGSNNSFSFTSISFGKEKTDPDVIIRGGNSEFMENNAFTLEDGRNINDEDVQFKRNVVLLGKDVQLDLFKNEYPLGKTVRIDGKPYLIIGLLEKKGQFFGSSFDNLAIIPYTTGIKNYGDNRGISIQVRAPEISKLEETIEEITGLMRIIREVALSDNNDFEITTNDSLASTFDVFTKLLYAVGIIVGLITLIGAGIGVMNIMLVSVTERTREIGVRKSVGATKKAIINQFLMEAIFICQIGGFIGLFLGMLGGNLVAILIKTEMIIPFEWIIGSFFGMLCIGLLFGVYPAYKAAQLDPIESLRYE